MMVVQRGGPLAVCALAGALCATLAVGCALFGPLESAQTSDAQRSLLPPLRPGADAVQLQVIFVDRPADDPLVNHLVWQEVDEVGAAPPALRAVLRDNGMRVAQCGASVPPALQTLLGLGTNLNPNESATSGRQLSLLSGQESEVLLGEEPQSCGVRYFFNGREELVEFEQARGLLRVRPVRLQDGWVRLEVIPEVHYGDSRMRPTATDDGWALRAGQKADVRHALKFQVTLNTGEMLIVGAAEERVDSLGQRFFRREQNGRMQQRLLVIRLADAGRTQRTAATEP